MVCYELGGLSSSDYSKFIREFLESDHGKLNEDYWESRQNHYAQTKRKQTLVPLRLLLLTNFEQEIINSKRYLKY